MRCVFICSKGKVLKMKMLISQKYCKAGENIVMMNSCHKSSTPMQLQPLKLSNYCHLQSFTIETFVKLDFLGTDVLTAHIACGILAMVVHELEFLINFYSLEPSTLCACLV